MHGSSGTPRPTRRRVLQAAALGLAAGVLPAAAAAGPDAALLGRLRRGTNLSTWTDAKSPRRGATATLKRLRALGFTHIRLPVDDEALHRYAGTAPDTGAYLDALRAQLGRLVGLGFAVSVDLHPGERLHALYRERPDEALAAAVSAWKALAPAVAPQDPAFVAAELLNEPPVDPQTWARHLPRLAAEVRRLLPRHTLVAGPAGPQRHEALETLKPLGDRNVVYAVHYYDPFAFTHQGADWNGTDSPLAVLRGLRFPASRTDTAMTTVLARLEKAGQREAAKALSDALLDDWTAAGVQAAFERMGAWSRRTGRPVIVNEFGVLANHAPRGARLAWLEAVAASAEAQSIGWTHWDFADGFGLLDRQGMLDEGTVAALLRPSRDAFAGKL